MTDYVAYYPDGWHDLPRMDTPITADALVHFDQALSALSAQVNAGVQSVDGLSGNVDLSTLYAALSIAPEANARAVGKGELFVNARDYGIAGNGVMDDTTAVQNALDATASGSGAVGKTGVCLLPPGRYLVTGLTIPSGVILRGAGKGITTLVQSGTPQFLVQLRGNQIPSVTTLTADAAVGATTLTVASTSSLAAGGIIALHDTVPYNPNDATYKSGEQLRIKSVDSSTQITIYGGVRGSWATTDGKYTVANGSAVTKLVMVNGGGLESLTFEGDQTSLTSMFIAQYVDRLVCRDVDVSQAGCPGLRIDGCRDVLIERYTCRDMTDDAANGHVGYGVFLSGPCENVVISGGAAERIRHAVTTGASAYGMPHQVLVTGMVVSEATNTGLDTHAAGDGILFADCIVTGCSNGINIRSRNTHIKGGLIDLATNHGVNYNETLCKNVSVRGVTIRRTLTGMGIYAPFPVDGLTIIDNHLASIGYHGIWIDSGSARVKVLRNTLVDFGTSASGRVGILSNATNGGTAATTGWDVGANLIGQETITTAASAINLSAGGLTGARAYDNRVYGTYSGTVFTATTLRHNERVDVALPTNADTSGATLAQLETEVNELKATLRTAGYLT